jgi:hypothetical protein
LEKRDEAAEAMKNAMSIESMPAEAGPAEYIGKERSGDRTYLLYRDKQGMYWYKTVFKTMAGYISEYEYIFGPKKNRRRR